MAIEMDQQGQLCQSDAQPSVDFTLTCNGPDGETVDGAGETVAVAVSVGTDIEPDVRRHLQHRTQKVKAVLFVRPTRCLDRHCLRKRRRRVGAGGPGQGDDARLLHGRRPDLVSGGSRGQRQGRSEAYHASSVQ